jgi:hypothetical protein
MAHGVKYRISYYRKSGGRTTIDILQRGYSSTITTLKGGASPFESSFEGDVNNIYAPTLGSGAVISIVSAPLDLLELFTADPQEWMVQVWDGVTDIDSDASSDSGGTLRWQGFINAEIYTEGYSNPIVSEKQFNCNDGMALLDDIQYKSTDVYIGKQTVGQIITNVLSKLELSWNVVFTSNDIQITDVVTNPFLYLDLFNENFVDESENPMTCRQVLESVIGGLGLSMYFEGYNIYVVDPINLHDTSKGKSYNSHTWGSETSVAVGGYLDISHREIRWGVVGTILDEIPALNEVIVKYNPYNLTELTYAFSDSANWDVEGTFVDMNGWWLNSTVEYKNWVIDVGNPLQMAMKDTQYSIPEYVLQLSDRSGEVSYTFPRSYIVQDTNMHLRLSMSVFVHTKYDSGDIFTGGVSHEVSRLIIPYAIKIGDQYYKGGISWDANESSAGTDKWQELWVVGSEMWADYLKGTINDEWITASVDIPLWPTEEQVLLTGDITVELLDELSTYFSDQLLPADEPFFSAVSDAKTNSVRDTGVTWERTNDSIIRVTIVGFKTHTGIEARCTLFDSAISVVVTTVPSGAVIAGFWHEADNTPHAFGSTVAQTTFTMISYVASTDTLIFDITTSGTPYFGAGYNHIDLGYATNMIYTYAYLAVLAFIKDVKIEIVNSWSRANIGNSGVEKTAVLSTNLLRKKSRTVEITSGVGPFGCSRGAFKSSQSTPADANIEGLFRGVDSTIYTNEELLLQSFISQYKQPRFKLNGRLNVYNQPLNIRTKLIKDSHYIGKAFYIVNGKYIDKEEMMDVEMIEVTDTREIIA